VDSSTAVRPAGAAFRAEVDATEVAAAVTVLDGLAVRADQAQPSGSYRRSDLTAGWLRFNGLGLDTKDYLLARYLDDIEFDSDGFTVRSGLLAHDPYAGQPIEFRQSENRAEWRIEADHVVSLHDAWTSGAHRWSPKGRNWMRLYNDPRNLLPTARAVNRAKGDANAAEWLPDNKAVDFRPRFAILQVLVKAAYRLSVTPTESAALRSAMTGVAD
jgi:hypothetical protein